MIKPMLAVLTDKAFDDPKWIFEIKWDGFRAIAQVNRGKVKLYSRNQNDLSGTFPKVFEALKQINHRATFDGEIVALEKSGRSSFQLLQGSGSGKAPIAYAIFDILELDGKKLTNLSLLERKSILKKVLPKNKVFIFGDYVSGSGKKFFKKAASAGLEGIMAKKNDSPYLLGQRSGYWLKIKTKMRQETVIIGFTAPQRSRTAFGSLVLAVREKNKWRYIGHCGTGFDENTLRNLYKKMKPLVTKKPPVEGKIPTKSPITWIKPQLVCEVKFAEWTTAGHLRVPVFLGLRTDKKAMEVVMEKPQRRRTFKGKDIYK